MSPQNPPPVARTEFHSVTQHGETRIDPYHWLRTVDWETFLEKPATLEPDIREYLEANNAHFKEYADANGITQLGEEIASEMASRIVPNDASVPQRDREWEYWREYASGAEHPVYLRRNLNDGRVQTVFDAQKESESVPYFSLGTLEHSPDQTLLAYTTDTSGAESYNIRIRNIETGQEYPETITHTKGSVAWAADGSAVYYVESDSERKARWVKRHVLGTDPKDDITIFTQPDDRFYLSIGETTSGEYLTVHVSGSDTSDVYVLRKDAPPETVPALITPRVDGHKYSVAHRGDYFYIRTNTDGAVNGKLMRAPVANPDRANWEDVVPYNPDVSLSGILALKNYLVRVESENAIPRVVVSDYQGHEFTVKFDDAAYALGISGGYMFDADTVRVTYETMANPGQTLDANLKTGALTVLKQKILPNGHNPDEYVVERHNIAARDGTSVPVTVLRHKSVQADGSAPLYLYGYGSYGIPISASFSSKAISIADRGAVYAIAHIRGGGDKGQQWYYAGKMETKQNTFDDFVDAAQALNAMGYGKPGAIVIEGGSAGGLLVGATLNQAPEGLIGGAMAVVPFVDVLNTISDKSLTLTPPEWTEWGNPLEDETAYQRIKGFSPYDNIDPNRVYPPLLATGGLTDPRVTYWEPAKWIARLRAEAKGGPFFLRINMESGHSGSAGRYEMVRERAHDLAFNLHQLAQQGYDLSLRVNYGSGRPGFDAGLNPTA